MALIFVIPAQCGNPGPEFQRLPWTPASAGATKKGRLTAPSPCGQCPQLLLIPGDGVEEEVVGAGGYEFLQSLPDLVGRAVDARGVGPFGIAIHDGEPAVQLGASDLRLLVDRHEYAFRDREGDWVAPCPLQLLAQYRHGSDKGGIARAARAHPPVGDRRGTAQRIRVTDTHPDRRGGGCSP